MHVEVLHKEADEGFIRVLRFRVVADLMSESPFHVLPDLIQLLVQKSLSSYVIHFIINTYGRFDIEINAEYPALNQQLLSLDLRKKVGRLHRFFYEPREVAKAHLAYDEFIDYLVRYRPRYQSLDDASLFSYPVHWHGLLETYQFLHGDDLDDDDLYHEILQRTDETWVSPAMNHKPCPFDKPDFFERQVIAGGEHFHVCLNYRPIGDSPFHVMIVPYLHGVDWVGMPPRYVFELEALLRATLSVCSIEREGLFVYMQKHAQSGMTVTHMHIHVLQPSAPQAFRDDVIQQLRFFALLLAGEEEKARTFARSPLSIEAMKQQIWRFKRFIHKNLEKELKVQSQLMGIKHIKKSR